MQRQCVLATPTSATTVCGRVIKRQPQDDAAVIVAPKSAVRCADCLDALAFTAGLND